MDPTLINPYSTACGNRMDIKVVREMGPSLVGKTVTVAGSASIPSQECIFKHPKHTIGQLVEGMLNVSADRLTR